MLGNANLVHIARITTDDIMILTLSCSRRLTSRPRYNQHDEVRYNCVTDTS